MPDKLDHGRSNLGTRPEAACRHLPYDRHVVVELHPHPGEATGLGTLLRRHALRHLGLHKNDHDFSRAAPLSQLYEHAGARLIRKVRDHHAEGVALAALYAIKRIVIHHREALGIPKRPLEPTRKDRILLDRRHRTSTRKQPFRKHAKPWSNFQDSW